MEAIDVTEPAVDMKNAELHTRAPPEADGVLTSTSQVAHLWRG